MTIPETFYSNTKPSPYERANIFSRLWMLLVFMLFIYYFI